MTEPTPRRASLPVQAKDVIVSFKGKERPWLSRVLGFILWPFIRRRARRIAADRDSRHSGGAA